MYIKLGTYEFYVGTDYVIRPERRKFRRFEKSISVSGVVSHEGLSFGYLIVISYHPGLLINEEGTLNDEEHIIPDNSGGQ